MKHWGNTNTVNIRKGRLVLTVFFAIGQLLSVVLSLFAGATAFAANAGVQQVSTSANATCAVVSYKVFCWGSNVDGMLGIGSNSGTITTPAAVTGGALNGKSVTKVSVGTTHACALANASVYCWGDNSYGQLGTRTTTGSPLPVAVDTRAAWTETTPAQTSCMFFFCSTTPAKTTNYPASALIRKEVIDISAGDGFTCALASDGTVACWGDDYYGQLGVGKANSNVVNVSSGDANMPKYATVPLAVVTTGALAGKKGRSLAKASANIATCVIAVDSSTTDPSASGNPYCWGAGMGTDPIPDPSSKTVSLCAVDVPSASSYGVLANAYEPVKIASSQMIKLTDGNQGSYMTGLGNDSKAYYWGLHGYQATVSFQQVGYAYQNVDGDSTASEKTASNPYHSTIQLAMSAGQARSNAQNRARQSNTGGGDKNRNLNSNNAALQSAQNAAQGGVSSSVFSSGGNLIVSGSLTNTLSYSASVASTVSGNNVNINSYRGVARPSGSSVGTSNVGNNKKGGSSGCTMAAQYKLSYTYKEIGTLTATPAPASSITSSLHTFSGDSYDGLFCGTNDAGTYCDTHGTSATEGETGSNYTQQCITSGGFWGFGGTTVCTPSPVGPQQVVTTGWLAGKTVSSLDTSIAGYTCAIANGTLGCWGQNGKSQLGDGTAANRNVPTAVSL